jgi:hypothetical protein
MPDIVSLLAALVKGIRISGGRDSLTAPNLSPSIEKL